MNPTTDPHLSSWVPVSEESDFPIQNLPYGVFQRQGKAPAVGVAIGEQVLDLAELHKARKFAGTPVEKHNIFADDALNAFMALGPATWTAVRRRVSSLLDAGNPDLRDDAKLRDRALVPQGGVQMLLPARIGDYTDFYSSIHHATNLGMMFRDPKNALLPNWRHIPVGYNGRASSIVVSGTGIRRPWGQTKADDAEAPTFQPSRLLDIELEVGFFTGPGNALGTPIPVERAREHIFGMVLVNDWSARDIQKWEYVPLGPFLGKSFGTTISPWVVPMEALERFRTLCPKQEPEVQPYLRGGEGDAVDIHLEVLLQTGEMDAPLRISATEFREMYWTMTQQLAHQTVNGTNARPGDLYASGTVSGPTPDSYGSLLEITWRGTRPIELPTGETRKFLQDGDTVILRGWAQGEGFRVGFGECRGTILPALEPEPTD